MHNNRVVLSFLMTLLKEFILLIYKFWNTISNAVKCSVQVLFYAGVFQRH